MALCTIIVNLGGKHLVAGMTPLQERILSGWFVRPLVIFAMVMLTTKQPVFAMIFALSVSFILDHMLNEQKTTCLFRDMNKTAAMLRRYIENKSNSTTSWTL